MSDNILPQRKLGKLIVVIAFDLDEEGEPQVAFGPAEQQSEERAVRTAKTLEGKHAGVIAWSRDADLELGEYGPPTILYQAGRVADME